MGNNTGKTTQDFRLRRLNATSPASLAKGFIQKAVLDQGISLHANGTMIDGGPATPQCGENGDGAFNWLIRLDTTAKTVLTGGAPPSPDPFNTGYCFAQGTIGGNAVQPITLTYTTNPDGTLSAGPVPQLNVPIFVHGDLNNVVVLPIHQASFNEVKISQDANCIGGFNPNALDNGCGDLAPEDCSKWRTDGSLGGYISIEESDKVMVQDLSATLCVLLTASSGMSPGVPCGSQTCLTCKKDASGNIAFKGDFCSQTMSPGGCGDSFWLSATFAASAVKINDGTGTPQCQGGPPVDASVPVDANAPIDAAGGG
jgi:hypothetical protein